MSLSAAAPPGPLPARTRQLSVCVVRDELGAQAIMHPPLVSAAMCASGFASSAPPIEGFLCAAPDTTDPDSRDDGEAAQANGPGPRRGFGSGPQPPSCRVMPGTWLQGIVSVREGSGGGNDRCWVWNEPGRAALAAIDPSLVETFVLPNMEPCPAKDAEATSPES